MGTNFPTRTVNATVSPKQLVVYGVGSNSGWVRCHRTVATAMLSQLKSLLLNRLGISRLNAAVSYMLARDLNLLSSTKVGEEGNSALRKAFLGLIPILRPNVFCDIGAHDGSMALAVRELVPECRVCGFEANPRIYAKHSAKMAHRGVEWLNLAVSDKNQRVPIFVPRTLTKIYVGGQVIPGKVVEGEDTGKTSLLLRNEEATYDRLEVDSRTLDDFFKRSSEETGERRFFLWIDVEGAADKILAGADAVLRETQAIFIETENFEFWKDQKRSGEILDFLYRMGFVPIARDREYSDKQFNTLFVRATLVSALHEALFDASSALRACLVQASELNSGIDAAPEPSVMAFASLSGWLQADVPVLVPCFNNPTYARSMLKQLRTLGFQRVVLVDNASTSPEIRAWLASLGRAATVITLDENLGPRESIFNPRNLALLPQRFCVTDPDLLFNPSLPGDFLGDLAALIERHKIGKVGFALDISDRHNMQGKLYRIGDRDWTIWDWEARFWERPLGELSAGDPVFEADIDTTFALYDKKYFDPGNFYRAIRVGGRFTARHLPWYKDCGVPAAELDYYRRTGKFSHYLGDGSVN